MIKNKKMSFQRFGVSTLFRFPHTSEPPPALSRRLLLAGLGAAGGMLLAGCSAPPRRQSTARGRLRTTLPDVAVRNPLQLSPDYREEAVARAMLALNTPYTYGGNTLEGGFDCSGLVQYVFTGFAARGLPRTTAQWAGASLPLADVDRLQRGDLVFFNTSGRSFSHMGIHVGNRQFVHAPSSGGTVRIDRMDSGYFGPRFDGGRSVFRA